MKQQNRLLTLKRSCTRSTLYTFVQDLKLCVQSVLSVTQFLYKCHNTCSMNKLVRFPITYTQGHANLIQSHYNRMANVFNAFEENISSAYICTFRCLRACSVTSSSFLFHSTAFIRQDQSKPITACSCRLFLFISSFTYTTI